MESDHLLVLAALARVATGPPLNGTVEVGGPEQFRLDELIRGALQARNDPREVVTDPEARYFGIAPGERTLLPEDDAQLGRIRYEDWSSQATAA